MPAMLPRKRKTSENEDDETAKKKSKDVEDFSEVKFKSMLKNIDTTFLALEEFVDAANAFPEFSEYDIVKNYIQGSPDCVEIFELIDDKELKSGETTQIFQVLERILVRTGDDLTGDYHKVGESIVSHLTANNSKQIIKSLTSETKASKLKPCIKLLTAMVIQGENSAMSVLGMFPEKKIEFLVPLFHRTNISEIQDVRMCMVHFIIAFLLTGSNSVVRQLLKRKVMVQNVFSGISRDKIELIEIVLPIFQEKVIENGGISKSAKVFIFTAPVLIELTKLYLWQGPQKFSDGKKNIVDRATEDDKDIVSELVHTFLLKVCCSQKHGIAFIDKMIGSGKMNRRINNITLYRMLTSLEKPHHHPKLFELVVQVLKECPDLLRHYLPSYQHSLSPRLSSEWLNAFNFIMAIYEQQPDQPSMITWENTSVTRLVAMLTTFIIPPDTLMQPITAGIKNEELHVRHKTIELHKFILSRTISFLDYMETLRSSHPHVPWNELTDRFKEVVLQNVPRINVIMNCWSQTFTPKQKDKSKESVRVFSAVPTSEHLCLLEQFLCLNQQLVPGILLDHPALLTALLDGVAKVTLDPQQDRNISSLQLYLLKIFSDADARLLPWKRESKDGVSLMHQLLGMLTRPSPLLPVTRRLICKLLKRTGLFEDESDELTIWLKHLVPDDNQQCAELPLLARVLNLYISNPYHYVHRLTEIISPDLPPGGDVETASVGSTDTIVDGILDLEEGEFSLQEETTEGYDVFKTEAQNRFPFSPLIVVAMEIMKNKEANTEGLKKFINRVIVDIFHMQEEVEPMRLLVDHYKDWLKGENCVEYIQSFTVNSKDEQKISASALMMSLPVNKDLLTEEYETKITETLVGLDNEDLAVLSQQILLYITEAVSKFQEKKKDNEKRIKLYMRLLQKLMNSMDKTQVDLDKETENIVKNLHLPRDDYIDVSTGQRSLLRNILRNSTLQKLFLYSKDSGLFGGVDESSSVLSTFVTSPMLQIIESSSCFFVHEDLKKLLCIYVDKILGKISDMAGQLDKSLVAKCLGLFLSNLDFSYQKQFLGIILNLPEKVIVSKKKGELTVMGTLVVELLLKILQNSKTLLKKLSLDEATKIFNCLSYCEDEKLLSLCSAILDAHPSFSLACSEDLWRHLLENSSERMEKIMLQLFNNNLICRQIFEEWLMTADIGTKTKWSSKVKNSIEVISTVYGSNLPKITNIQDSKELEIIQQLVLKNRYGKKEMTKMWKSIASAVDESTLLQTNHTKLLLALYTQLVAMDTRYREKLVLVCMKMLLNQVVKKNKDEHMKCSLLDIVLDNIEHCNSEELSSGLSEIWQPFVKSCLKSLYMEPKLIKVLIHSLPYLYTESCDQNPPIRSLYEMVMSHSKFLTVMFEENMEDIKETIISLLLSIAEKSHDCHDSAHIRIFLAAYGASLSISDQKLLKLIHLYEMRLVNLVQYKPFMFGKTALDFYASSKYQTPSILRVTKMADMISCLSVTRLNQSALNFPIYRRLMPTEVKPAVDYKSSVDCYDPCFLLPVFNQLLQADITVDLKQFINTNCLAYVLSGLSSYAFNIRQVSYLVLKNFYDRLKTAEFEEAAELRYLLRMLKRSIETPGMKLSTVVTAFLGRASKLFIRCENNMYRKVAIYLVSKTFFEFDKIPGFYRFFNTTELDHHYERAWMLGLLADGLRTYDDYMIYGRMHCFNLIQSYFTSSVSDAQSQGLVLKVISAASLDVDTIVMMYERNAILTWILSVINNMQTGSPHMTSICEIIYNFWFTIYKSLPSSDSSPPKSFLPLEYINQIIQCVKELLTKLGPEDSASLSSLLKTLSSSLQYLRLATKESNGNNTVVSVTDISLIFLLVGKFGNLSRLFNQAKNILSDLGLDIGSQLSRSSSSNREAPKTKYLEVVSEEKIGIDDKVPNMNEVPVAKQRNSDDDLMIDVMNICLCWSPVSTQSTRPMTAAAFLSAVSCCLDNCVTSNDLELKVKVVKWIGSVLAEGSDLGKKCREALQSECEFTLEIIGGLLKMYSNCVSVETVAIENSSATEVVVNERRAAVIFELNKIFLSMINDSCKKKEVKKSLAILNQLDYCDKIEELKSVFIQEFFLTERPPKLFQKLSEKTSRTSSQQETMETDDQEQCGVTMETPVSNKKKKVVKDSPSDQCENEITISPVNKSLRKSLKNSEQNSPLPKTPKSSKKSVTPKSSAKKAKLN